MVDHRRKYLNNLAQNIKPTDRGAVVVTQEDENTAVRVYNAFLAGNAKDQAATHIARNLMAAGQDLPHAARGRIFLATAR